MDRRARLSGRVADRPDVRGDMLPTEADGARVSDRIAGLADTVDAVGLTDNHARCHVLDQLRDALPFRAMYARRLPAPRSVGRYQRVRSRCGPLPAVARS